MKKYFTIVLLILSILKSYSQTRYDVNFMVDGRLRESIIVKPSTPPPAGGYPVVFMLHGTSGDGEKFYNISGWKELGEEENFITVFPSSLSWCFVEDGIEKHNTRWVNGSVTEYPCSGPPQNYVDDVKFLKVLAQKITDTFTVNASKIFACGFSNGCSMIHKLAVDAGNVFAALAGTSSVLSPIDSSTPVNRVPLWTMVGTLDDRFIVPPYTALPYGEDSILNYLKYPLKRVLGTQGLTETFTKTETPYTHTYEFNESQMGQTSKRYLFSLVKDMTHQFPNGTNHPVDGPRIFWNFFKQSVTVGNDDKVHLSTTSEILAYPNPSSKQISISIPGSTFHSYQWKLINSSGIVVRTGFANSTSDLILSESETGKGFFVFQVDSEHQVIRHKLIFN